jgi:hypothetical protein
VDYATKACELTEWKSANFIGTLAAAYAEAGILIQPSSIKSRQWRFQIVIGQTGPKWSELSSSTGIKSHIANNATPRLQLRSCLAGS